MPTSDRSAVARSRCAARRATGGRRSAGRCPCRAARRRPAPGRAAGPSAARRPRKPRSACTWRGVAERPGREQLAGAGGPPGGRRIHMASIRNRSCSRASATRSSASAALRVSGFSHSTGLPASRASRACSRCRACGEATYTTSTSGSLDQLLVGAVRRGGAVLGRERGGALRRAGADRGELGTRGPAARSRGEGAAILPVARMPQRTGRSRAAAPRTRPG